MNKKIIYLFFTAVFLTAQFCYAKGRVIFKTSIALKEMQEPNTIKAVSCEEGTKIFITDSACASNPSEGSAPPPCIAIYLLSNDGKNKKPIYIKSFGAKGGGARHFELGDGNFLHLFEKNDRLVVRSVGRITEIDLDGNFIRESTPAHIYFYSILAPIGEGYANIRHHIEGRKIYDFLNFYDSKFKLIKKINFIPSEFAKDRSAMFKKNSLDKIRRIPASVIQYKSFGDKFFLAYEENKKIILKIFNPKGEIITDAEIDNIEPAKIPKTYIDYANKVSKKIKTYLKNDKMPPYKKIELKKKCPLFKRIFIDNEKIYFISYEFKTKQTSDGKQMTHTKAYIYNTKGRPEGYVWLPLDDTKYGIYPSYNIDIKNNHLFVIEDEGEEEGWQLKVYSIEN